MTEGHGLTETRAEEQKAETLSSVIDDRFSWRYVKQQPSKRKRILIALAWLILIALVVSLVFAFRFANTLAFTCAYDNQGQRTCFFFFPQPLPPGCPPDCAGVDLHNANLSGMNLGHADLSGADLSGAELRQAELILADLSEADLQRAELRHAHLLRANL